MTGFLLQSERRLAEMPFGKLSWLSGPLACGAKDLAIMEVHLQPQGGHSFHYHADQEELIYVLAGRIEQWLGQERRVLAAGDAIVIPRGAVHGSFNCFAEPARVLAILGPCRGEDGYQVVDVFDRAPWNAWRSGPITADAGRAGNARG